MVLWWYKNLTESESDDKQKVNLSIGGVTVTASIFIHYSEELSFVRRNPVQSKTQNYDNSSVRQKIRRERSPNCLNDAPGREFWCHSCAPLCRCSSTLRWHVCVEICAFGWVFVFGWDNVVMSIFPIACLYLKARVPPLHSLVIYRCKICVLYLSTSVVSLLSPSGDLGIGLVWDNHPYRLFGPTVEILFKLN